MDPELLAKVVSISYTDETLIPIVEKTISGKRLSSNDAFVLYEKASLGLLGVLATLVREQKNQKNTFFVRNTHIEPTNICIHNCQFCSYRRGKGKEGSWESTIDEILNKINSAVEKSITEVHIVGGTHPEKDVAYYAEMLKEIRNNWPELHIKAFTAVEIDYMAANSSVSTSSCLSTLIENGLNSMPGGGAEIFDEKIRAQICPSKSSSEIWLKIHKEAHTLGIPTNATMLYGHVENYQHRIDHMERLRNLQDQTKGFNCFIPLKYRQANNSMSEIGEVSYIDDLRNFSIARIFLDNFPHIKAYWPMIGKEITQISLSFGVDDVDGTIEDSTKIYSMAGAKDQNPVMTTNEIVSLIKEAGLTPIERDAVYNFIEEYE